MAFLNVKACQVISWRPPRLLIHLSMIVCVTRYTTLATTEEQQQQSVCPGCSDGQMTDFFERHYIRVHEGESTCGWINEKQALLNMSVVGEVHSNGNRNDLVCYKIWCSKVSVTIILLIKEVKNQIWINWNYTEVSFR